MNLLRRSQTSSEIPTSSMADIAFLLIIFFMVTAVFAATKGLEFKLPQEEEQAAAEEEDAVFIQVFADASIEVDCKTDVGLSGMLDYLEPKLTRNPEKPVIIYSDPEAPYQGMISVYDALVSAENKRGFKVKNISIPTQSDIQDYIELFGVNPFEVQCQ